jgi:outer membrane protein OmpA-like peptidoglycan-associated protein
MLPMLVMGQTNTFGWNDKTFKLGQTRKIWVQYELDRATLRNEPEIKMTLDTVVDFLKRNPTLKVEIDNYSIYYPEHSIRYSQPRAVTVADTLIKMGIDSTRLVPRGCGIMMERTKNGKRDRVKDSIRQTQRRTEIKILDN